MTNEEAIEVLKNDIEICTIQQKQACDMAIKALEQTRWIPVDERLPEEQGCYLVTYKWKGKHSGTVYTETDVIEYDETREKWVCGDGNIIAWMPLPQPYKAESEDEE